jgi:spermidine synthase
MTVSDLRQWGLPLCFGAVAAVAQVLVLREALVVLGGNELSLALMLAAWLGSVCAGATTGARLVSRGWDACWLVVAAGGSLSLALPLALLFLRATRLVVGVAPGLVLPPLTALGLCLAVAAPLAGAVGFSFTPLARWAARTEEVGQKAAVVYAAEGLGAFAGGALFTFLLAGRVAPLVVAGGTMTTLLGGCAMAFWAGHRRAGGVLAGFALLSALAIPLGGWGAVEDWSARLRWESLGTGGELVAVAESPYQRLELSEQRGQFNLFANGSPLLSFPDPYTAAPPVHAAMTQAGSRPGRVLFVGGGAVDRVAAALHHQPRSVEYVTTDPAELDLLRPRVPPAQRRLWDGAATFHHGDGRQFLSRARPGAYDLIVVETAEPLTTMANRYYTEEFYRICARALSPQGVLAVTLDAAHYLRGEAGVVAAALHQSLVAIFGNVALGPGVPVRFYASPSPGVVTDDAEELVGRWRRRHQEEVSEFSPYLFDSMFDPAAVAWTGQALAQQPAVVNSDLRPVSYLAGLALWDQKARGADQPSPLWHMGRLDFVWLWLPLLLLLGWRVVAPRRGRPGGEALWAMTVAGFFGMALEVLLLLIFQNVRGSLYAALGVLVALFMVGLAGGTWLASRVCVGHPRRSARWAIAVDVIALLLALTFPLLLDFGETGGLLAGLWMALAGGCTGAMFPPVVSTLCERWGPERQAWAVGLADGLDHVGAAFGALTVALVLLPVAGLWGSALLLALLKLISLAGWIRAL